MLIEGPLKSGKTTMLTRKFVELLSAGVSSSEILVICLNSHKKRLFVEKVKAELCDSGGLCGFGSLPIFTMHGIVYNSMLNNWAIVEGMLDSANSVIIPDLCGLETTEYVMKLCIAETDFSDYYSEINRMQQLLRRYTLITENSLTKTEVQAKSALLNQSFAGTADRVLDKFKLKTLNLRSFDYLKQLTTFLYLFNNGKLSDFNDLKYLIVDDFDELSYSAQSFVKALIPQLKEYYFAADPLGGTRRGYLCAYPQGWSEVSQGAEKIILDNGKGIDLKSIELTRTDKKAEMLDKVLHKLEELLKDNAPGDIKIVAPTIDSGIKCVLSDFFNRHGVKYQFLSGVKKLTDSLHVFSSLVIVRLINEKWCLRPSNLEVRMLFADLLGFPVSVCGEIIAGYGKKGLSEDLQLECEEFDAKYQGLIRVIKRLKEGEYGLYEQLFEVFNGVVLPNADENADFTDFNTAMKSLEGFSRTVERLARKPQNPEKEWLLQIMNTVVADNPASAPDIEEDCVVIATPQKVIDLELTSKYHLWTDISSSNWTKDDQGPLYNSWVFTKSWNHGEYTNEIHRKLTLEKTLHVLRKLILCNSGKIFAYMSLFDAVGKENTGDLPNFIGNETKPQTYDFKNIEPYEDQKPILLYNSGKMAIPAVPGAGKTTIMQALIIKLLKSGEPPEKILVLTYMESAARIFQEKIKKACPGLTEFPHISTIHSLAYKIIQDNDNFVKLGLNSDFAVCDDIEKSNILENACLPHLPYDEKEFDWIKMNKTAVSTAKHLSLTPECIKTGSNQYLREFLPVYKDYRRILAERNLIDYDDLLVYAVKLLKNHPEVRNEYQNQFKFVIEDEAQDSSRIQQELISIISGGNGNLIRCGDTNQAITTTFSNADVKGFRDFIADAEHKVEMVSSQRCAERIYSLANHMIDWTKDLPGLENTFFDIKMCPVGDKNPENRPDNLNFRIHDTVFDEKEWVVDEITKTLDDKMTCGILLRGNFQVADWANYLESKGIKYICRTEGISQKKVFKFILKYLEVIENPWHNKLIYALYEEFTAVGILERDAITSNFLKNEVGSPFISFDPLDLKTENLTKFWWEINYWIHTTLLQPDELVVRLGSYYFHNVFDRSNVHLVAAIVHKVKHNKENPSISAELSNVITYLKELVRKKVSIKYFDEVETSGNDDALAGYVQIMTVHKAKGNEFDLVFMPEMYENSYSITDENVKIGAESFLVEELNGLAGLKKRTDFEIKVEQMEENLRLVYVGITRAKQYLYMSASCKRSSFKGHLYDAVPSKILEHFRLNIT